MSALPSAFEPVAITTRSGFDESVHYGVAVAYDAVGQAAFSVGDPTTPIYPRSANKPMQADAMLKCGWTATPEQVALACGSHAGTDRHIEVVLSILDDAGLGPDALGNTPDLPMDRPTAERFLATGGQRSSLRAVCSGKHAAMLATCVANGWDLEGYLHTSHPLQLAITEHVQRVAGHVDHIGIDGCGAPVHTLALSDLAAAFGRLALDQGEVFRAMTAHPELVGGDRLDATRIMRLVDGLMAKDGAEGVFAAGLPDGRCAAVKIADGGQRAAGMLLATALRAVDVDIDPDLLGAPILGHGEPVGSVRIIANGTP